MLKRGLISSRSVTRAARVLVLVVALRAREEEQLVLDQRPAQLGREVQQLFRLGGGAERRVDARRRVVDVVAGQAACW